MLTILKKNAGFTLIEVLVSVIVLSIGLLGLAALQGAGVRNNQQAFNRSQATQLAYDIADRIRANKTAVGSYVKDSAGIVAAQCPIAANGNLCTACQTIAQPCTPGQMAQKDLFEFKSNLALLPNSGASIDVNGSGVYTITITWNESKNKDSRPTVFLMSFSL